MVEPIFSFIHIFSPIFRASLFLTNVAGGYINEALQQVPQRTVVCRLKHKHQSHRSFIQEKVQALRQIKYIQKQKFL